MIGYLNGDVVAPNVLSAGGVGYVISVTAPLVPGTKAALWVTTVVREDSITLYGFETQDENVVFQALCKVVGVGPSMAMSVMRDVGVAGVLSLDPKAIARASGVGAKKAEAIASGIKLPAGLVSVREPWHEVAQTLISLGFDEKRSNEAARTALESGESDEAKLLSVALEEVRR